MIETYPEADAYGVWAPEHSPDFEAVDQRTALDDLAAVGLHSIVGLHESDRHW